jgi:hypothetical protein
MTLWDGFTLRLLVSILTTGAPELTMETVTVVEAVRPDKPATVSDRVAWEPAPASPDGTISTVEAVISPTNCTSQAGRNIGTHLHWYCSAWSAGEPSWSSSKLEEPSSARLSPSRRGCAEPPDMTATTLPDDTNTAALALEDNFDRVFVAITWKVYIWLAVRVNAGSLNDRVSRDVDTKSGRARSAESNTVQEYIMLLADGPASHEVTKAVAVNCRAVLLLIERREGPNIFTNGIGDDETATTAELEPHCSKKLHSWTVHW